MIALEFISDRMMAILADRKAEVPAEAIERIRDLEAQLAAANARLITEGHSANELAAALPALAQAIKDTQEHFDRLIADARDEVPVRARTQIAELEGQLAQTRSELEGTRRDRDEAQKMTTSLVGLRDACIRWDTDNYSPRLKSAIVAFRRQEVGKR